MVTVTFEIVVPDHETIKSVVDLFGQHIPMPDEHWRWSIGSFIPVGDDATYQSFVGPQVSD